MTEIEIFLLVSLFRKFGTLVLHARSTKGTFSIHSRCASTGALSPTIRSTNDAFSIFGKCTGAVSREKNEDSRPFSKVDEVDVYPYYLGQVAFRLLIHREDPFDPSS